MDETTDPPADGPQDLFRARLGALEPALSPTALRVARFIDQHRAIALSTSAAGLAERIGTSDATVVRTVQSLGFAGLGELRAALAASFEPPSTPADAMRRTLAEVGDQAERAIDHVLATHAEAIEALRVQARPHVIAAVEALRPAARILVFGIGPSAPLAHYVALLLVRDGRRAAALSATGIALADQLLGMAPGDAVILLAYGQPYREVLATVREAKRLGLPIVLVTDSAQSRLVRHAHVVVPAMRGRADRVALHAATLAVLEAIVLGLAACDRGRAVATLERLTELRRQVGGPPPSGTGEDAAGTG